jgi:hypothetical protein
MSSLTLKPGSLAVIVLPYRDQPMVGLTVTIVEKRRTTTYLKSKNGDLSHGDGGENCWVVNGHHDRLPCVVGGEYLRPLRDPGEDARDETLDWLPLPFTTKDAA